FDGVASAAIGAVAAVVARARARARFARAGDATGGASQAGSTPTRIPTVGSSGSVGQLSGVSDGLRFAGSMFPAAIITTAATSPLAATHHSGAAHGSGR